MCRADPPFTQNTQAASGPRNTRGPPCSQIFFRIFVSFWVWPEHSNLFECGALSPSLRKNLSNRVTWMSYSLAKKNKKTSWKRTESWKRWALSSSANRDGVKQTNALHPYFHHVDQQSKFIFRIDCNHSKIDNIISHTCIRSYTSLRGCLTLLHRSTWRMRSLRKYPEGGTRF